MKHSEHSTAHFGQFVKLRNSGDPSSEISGSHNLTSYTLHFEEIHGTEDLLDVISPWPKLYNHCQEWIT